MFIAQHKETKERVEVWNTNIQSPPQFLIYSDEREEYVWVSSKPFEPLFHDVKLKNKKKI